MLVSAKIKFSHLFMSTFLFSFECAGIGFFPFSIYSSCDELVNVPYAYMFCLLWFVYHFESTGVGLLS